MRLKRETQGAFCVLNANAKSQTRKSMKINVICTVYTYTNYACKIVNIYTLLNIIVHTRTRT